MNLPESRIYKFVSRTDNISLVFFEGQKLIADLITIHQYQNTKLKFFRDLVLSVQHLQYFLKSGETLGFYIDNEIPYFSFKIELNEFGKMRSLLFCDSKITIPEKLNGICRLNKISPNTKSYQTHVELNEIHTELIVNHILNTSYQVEAFTFLSKNSDASIFIHKLPSVHPIELPLEKINQVKSFLELGETQEQKILAYFNKMDFDFLISHEISFNCSCSPAQFQNGIERIVRMEGIEAIFGEDEEVSTECDYCHKKYNFPRKQFKESLN